MPRVKTYLSVPGRMDKINSNPDSFTLSFPDVDNIEKELNSEIMNLVQVFVYNGHEVSFCSTSGPTVGMVFRKNSNNPSAFHFREFDPEVFKNCLVCMQKRNKLITKNTSKTHCKTCTLEYYICDLCMKYVDLDLLPEEAVKALRWGSFKLCADDFLYTLHKTYASKNFCSTACLESYKIVPMEALA